MYKISEKQIRTRDKYKKKAMSNNILIYILALIMLSSIFSFDDSIVKASNSTADISAMVAPIQSDLFPKISFIKNMNGLEVTFTKLSEYTIAGRVVEEYDYTNAMASFMNLVSGKNYFNDIASKDVAISYGPLALNENHNKMTYMMTGTRRISYAVNNLSLYDSVGSIDEIGKYVTNNHLIPANSDVEKLIQKIQKDDFVQITGSLVNAVWQCKNQKYEIVSSLSRLDVKSNACEIIYVEDVKWIK